MIGAFDLVVVVALVLGYLVGRAKGFLWQLSGILTLALGYVFAAALSRLVARAFPGSWPEDLRSFAAWAAIYAVVSIGVYLVFMKLQKRIRELEFEELDRRFGGALGAVKAGLLVLVVSVVFVTASANARDVVRASPSGRLLARAGVTVRFLLPDRVGDKFGECLENLRPEPVAADAAKPAPAPAPVPARPAPAPRPAPRPRPTELERAPAPSIEPDVPEKPRDDPNAGDGEETPARSPAPRETKPAPAEKDDPLTPPRAKDQDPLAPPPR
ncbi:CvpA family protein [bacterium]|nr:CvpA family protein [bacterium]